jgi:glutamate carboxypeptidase
MQQLRNQIEQYINVHRQEMMDLWETIVNIESGHTQKAGVDSVCAKLIEVMQEAGIKTRVVEHQQAGNMLIGQWGDSNAAPILFIGHMDTVFAEGVVKERPFTVKDGFAYGPGVLDMKAGLVMEIYITKALISIGYNEHPIKLLFAGDEEVLHMKSNTRDLLYEECKGGFVAFNFETGYMHDGIVVGRRGGEIFSIDVDGIQAHSGNNPTEGRNALEEMSYKIIDIQKLNDFEQGALVNMAIISAAESENIIPGKCSARGGMRFPTVTIHEQLSQKVKAIAEKVYVEGTSAKYTTKTIIDCMEPVENNYKLYGFIEQVAKEIGYKGDLHPFVVGGASDSSAASRANVPVVCGLGPRGEWNHSPKEYADVESVFTRSIWIATAITQLNQLKFEEE